MTQIRTTDTTTFHTALTRLRDGIPPEREAEFWARMRLLQDNGQLHTTERTGTHLTVHPSTPFRALLADFGLAA